MQTRLPLILAAAALVATGVAQAAPSDQLRDRLRARIAERMASRANDSQRARAADETLTYGADPLQALDFWRAKGTAQPAPLVVFVHGGGWKRGDKGNATGAFKPVHYPQSGYAFASINYRLVPAATVEEQAADVAAALKALLGRAGVLGIDRTRVVLMGHSAGAHLVALVGTDERYLRGAGLTFADVAGVIPLDGAAYDVPAQMQDGPRIMQQTYAQAFGTDLARQRALSPTLQAAAPNAPAFLIPHVQREDGTRQSGALAVALKAAGTRAETAGLPGTGLQGHAEINRRMGDPAYAGTGVVDVWLRRVFGG